VNGPNALIFALLGTAMGLLPALAPSWFPPNGADGTSARALWLDTMGAVQVALGLGHLVGARFVPAALRVLRAIPASDLGAFAVPDPHTVVAR